MRDTLPAELRMHWESLNDWAGEEVEAVLLSLPDEIRAATSELVIFVEDIPSGEDRESGVGTDWLGIFEGATVRDFHTTHPPRIRLWAGNLWRYSGANERRFRDEVRVTLLHEIGHFLGLDEDGVARLGLA